LPDRPDRAHLRAQARDLLRSGAAASLAAAQFAIAKRYGFASWPKLKAHVESLSLAGQLKAAIDAEDLPRVLAMMTAHPELHRAALGYGGNGPLTWVAECRVPGGKPSAARLEMARWMIAHGSDVHQGGDGPLMRAALNDQRIPMMELLVAHGADVNARWDGRYPIVCAPCESLQAAALRWLLERGAKARSGYHGGALAMVVGTYARDVMGKHACLRVLADAGVPMPDSPTLALHAGRIDLLEDHLRRDPALLSRRFSQSEIFPTAIGMRPEDGLTATPVDGGTLLHLAIEMQDLASANWLIDRGADVDARAAIDLDGFGGHTPLHQAVVSMGARDGESARLLLAHSADPGQRATFRKQLKDVGDPDAERMREFRDVTSIGYARAYQVQRWVDQAAVGLIAARTSGI
nr:ankyrin repeat domain-containing protein [Planctomycetota bacterium]